MLFESAKLIAAKIDEGYYDLTNDNSGIKVGIDNQNSGMTGLSTNVVASQKKGCCK